MTAALYDVKARFSEYVTMAEQGEVIKITKHGVATTVLLSLKLYEELCETHRNNHKPSFMDQVKKWRLENADYLDNEYADTVEKLVQEDKKHTDSGINPLI